MMGFKCIRVIIDSIKVLNEIIINICHVLGDDYDSIFAFRFTHYYYSLFSKRVKLKDQGPFFEIVVAIIVV